jgi:hypothetical protein
LRQRRFAWFEHISSDPIGSADAWATALGSGWTARSVDLAGAPYPMLWWRGVPSLGFIHGPHAGWTAWALTEDVDAHLAHALAAGAVLNHPPTDRPGLGRAAGVITPAGDPLWLYTTHRGAGPCAGAPGATLLTARRAAAEAFYGALWGERPFDVPTGAPHTTSAQPTSGESCAGLSVTAGPVAGWRPRLFAVAPAQTTAWWATHGGSEQTPGGASFPVVVDREGCAAELVVPAPPA